MVGDAAYDPWPLLDQMDDRTAGHGVLARTELFAELLDVPAERILAWGLARSVESALWELDQGRLDSGAAAMRSAGMLAQLV